MTDWCPSMATFISDPSCASYVGAIAFDVGSVTTRVGYAGDDTPRAIFPSTIFSFDAAPSSEADGGSAAVVESDAHISLESLRAMGENAIQTQQPRAVQRRHPAPPMLFLHLG